MKKASQIENHVEKMFFKLQGNSMQENLFFTRSIELFVASKAEMIKLMKEN